MTTVGNPMKDGLDEDASPSTHGTADHGCCQDCRQRQTHVSHASRRQFLTAATTALGTLGAGLYVTPLLRSLGQSPPQQSEEEPRVVTVTHLAEGESVTVRWRDLPVWIVRRSATMLGALASVNNRLKDPYSNNPDQQPAYVLRHRLYRSIRPEISVLIGQCTHLGCIPTHVFDATPQPFDRDWKGGYFCPCHRSRFDLAGRVYRDDPAQANLIVPPHYYRDPQTLVIGQPPPRAAETPPHEETV